MKKALLVILTNLNQVVKKTPVVEYRILLFRLVTWVELLRMKSELSWKL